MSSTAAPAPRLFSGRMAVGLVLISAFSLLTFLVLTAYAPDLRTASDGDTHAMSKSAIGFAALFALLEDQHVPVLVDRGLPADEEARASLHILTPPWTSNAADIRALKMGGPRLLVLPKWLPFANPDKAGWVMKAGTVPPDGLAKTMLQPFSKSTKLHQRKNAAAVELSAPQKSFQPFAATKLATIDQLQTISGKDWIVLLESPEDGPVLVQLRGSDFYVLSEPDLLNTHGMGDLATAFAATQLVKALRRGDGPIEFDVTLNGYGRSLSLLRAIFAPPFLGGTLCVLLAAGLIGLRIATRFGSPLAAPAGYALGKTALAGNTADLIRMLRREPRMAARYALTTRNLVLKSVGAPRELGAHQTDAFVTELERAAKTSEPFAKLLEDAHRAKTRYDLLRVAGGLYRWRQGITHEH